LVDLYKKHFFDCFSDNQGIIDSFKNKIHDPVQTMYFSATFENKAAALTQTDAGGFCRQDTLMVLS